MKYCSFFIKSYKIIYKSKNIISIFINNNRKLIIILEKLFYFIKLSQFTKQPLLVDIISYNNVINNKKILTTYVIKQLPKNTTYILITKHSKQLPSLSKYFPNSIWFERENKEFFNLQFLNITDNRNLLLPYVNTEFPLLKSYPTIGFREIYYNTITNNTNYSILTIQY